MNTKNPMKKSDIIYHVLKGWRVVLLFTLAGLIAGIGLIGAGYIRGEISREYRITSSVAIVALNKDDQFTSRSNNPFKSDVDIARNITETALYIIKSQSNTQKVIDKLNLKNVSANTISNNLSLKRFEDTEIIELTLLWRSEREGLEIMKTLNQVSDSALLDILKIGRVSVVNEPKANFIVGENIGVSTWIYAALFGLVAGVLFCLLRFIFAATVINATDLDEVFGLDLLASLPYDQQFRDKRRPVRDDLPIRDDLKSLAHMLINRMEQSDVNRIYITSTKHDEGRTALIANVAMYMADLGKRTLLIDCDLNNPQLGVQFKDELLYEQTLNALYRGDADKLDAVLHISGCLDLLPVILEKVPDSFNDAMLQGLAEVMEGYDYVLIDAAPVGSDAEVLRLNEITDAALFVVRCDYASVDSIKKALIRLGKSGVPVIGGVFNAASTWRDAFKKTKKRMDDFDMAVTEGRKGRKARKAAKKAQKENASDTKGTEENN